MRILYSDCQQEVTDAKIVVLWGAGLIGQAIYDALLSKDQLLCEDYDFPWENNAAQQQAAKIIKSAIEKIFLALALSAASKPRVVFVWSAGQAGFSATAQQTEQEMAAFMIVLELALQLQQLIHDRVEFHLLSSAGGLFEGRKTIEHGDLPEPRRPYGQLKLDQEQALLKADGIIASIYRAASVYGVPCQGRRSSLISVLLHRGLLRQVVSIVGAPTTLRDYVYVDDVGHYIARKIEHPDLNNACGGVYWMVTGKPSSLLEITRLVEDVIRHRLYLAYTLDPDNCSDITFSSQLKPVDFHPIPPAIGISLVYRHWQEFI